jgi:hypothetical protein
VPATRNERRRGQGPGHHDQISARRRGYIGLGITIKYLRRTVSAIQESGLGTIAKYLRGATCIGLVTTIIYLQRTTSGAAGSG